MPKLSQTLSKCDIRSKKEEPIQSWLTPWCEIIGKKNMRTLFEIVKVQLTPIFSDKKAFKDRALELFAPWVTVMDS